MNPGISKSRVRRVVEMRRRLRADRGPRASFRDGTVLAVLYAALAVLAALVLSFLVPGSLGALGSGGGAVHTAFANVGVLCAAVICGRLLLGQLAPGCVSRNSRVLMLCLVAAFADLLCVAAAYAGDSLLRTGLPLRWAAEGPDPFVTLFGLVLPHLFAPVLATLLAGPGAGVSLGVALALQNVLFVPKQSGLAAVLLGILAAIVAPIAVSGVRRRGPLLRVMFLLGLVQLAALVSAACAVPDLVPRIAQRIGEAEAGSRIGQVLLLLSGMVLFLSPAAVLLLLGPLEHVFAACSDVQLEWKASLPSQ